MRPYSLVALMSALGGWRVVWTLVLTVGTLTPRRISNKTDADAVAVNCEVGRVVEVLGEVEVVVLLWVISV